MDDDDIVNLWNVRENDQQPKRMLFSIKFNKEKKNKFQFEPHVRRVVEHHVILDIYQMFLLY